MYLSDKENMYFNCMFPSSSIDMLVLTDLIVGFFVFEKSQLVEKTKLAVIYIK